ncbi:MAG: MG2 domain-containing protein [Sphingobacterium sp.]|nr:MG2 domain-containing protein [Sphingobacterium sp.]
MSFSGERLLSGTSFVAILINNNLKPHARMKKFILYFSVLAFLTFVSLKSNTLYSQDLTPADSLLIIEKVYLQTDRESYYPGEDLWFSAWLIDASSQILSAHSTSLHVELISPSLKITASLVARLNGGLGKGDFHLPDSLKPGRYRLRAYTNYMRNFGDKLFYKEILIINSSDGGTVLQDSVKAIVDNPELSFFPEGGSLVDDVTSVVAFKAENSQGHGLDLSGEIYSSADELVTPFKSRHKGIGVFHLPHLPVKIIMH